ncbi:hypothetical protein HGRIS_006743 [Hohenbuehelia grisea]|uniref:Metallothionein n=1 Tax=Hohenbuehelia grisea TaxID=104357 RepID=A0ABR3JA06_9AGAR
MEGTPSSLTPFAFSVDTLLNPCKCKSIRRCKCRNSSAGDDRQAGLETLARAAALCCAGESNQAASPKVGSRPPTPPGNAPKRRKRTTPASFSSVSGDTLSLPPITPFSAIIPPAMPPMSKIDSLAGSGCTCGFTCACPGCEEHQAPGSSGSSTSRRRCADGCGNCVDPSLTALPGLGPPPGSSILDQFYARAASLPEPSTSRRMGGGWTLDPTNVLVYPSSALTTTERSAAFGLVNVPKLECCAGKCGCPNGRCGCGTNCDGCCADHGGELGRSDSPTVARQPSVHLDELPAPVAVRSCCAGKG